jgi:hypothetical protein
LHAVDAAGNEVDEDAGLVRIADRTPPPTPTPAPTPAPSPPASSPPATGPPAPIADDARIAAHLESGGRHGRRLTIGARGHARIRGRLSRASGVPIGGATLTVLARRGERGWHAAGVTRTRADGRFTAPLAAGPSRRLTVAFERRRSVPMRLDVRAWVRLVVELRRGQRVLAGRLARPVPPGGAFVTVQRRVRGRWATAWRLRTSPTGRFAWRAPRGPATVRARVPTEPGYPYATGWSHAVRLR